MFPVPGWDKFTALSLLNPLEHVPELMWPTSVRQTYPRMRHDSQLSGLFRGTTLPIRRYVWGVDPNGADPQIVESVCAELGLQTIDEAWKAFQTGQSAPVKRARNRFSFDRFQADALKAAYLGHYLFEQVYDVAQDGPSGLNGGWFAHLAKLAPRAPWTISEFYVNPDGGLAGVRQLWQPLQNPPIPVSQLVAFVFEQDPGEWTGNSLFRPCFREWLTKDLLYKIDTINHEKAGGILITEAPQDALPAEVQALGSLSAQLRVGGGGAIPAGANPVFLRATGSDVIASINQRDEAMARAFLMMFMSLGTSSSGGNRALSQSFVDWFAIAQEAIAIWFRDIVSEHVIKDFVDLNWDSPDYVPQLVFKRPEQANPLDTLAQVATDGGNAGAPTATALVDGEGVTAPVATSRNGARQVVLPADMYEQLVMESHAFERDKQPYRHRHVHAAAGDLPERNLRRQPTQLEQKAAVDFKAADDAWQANVEQLVAGWQTIRSGQIDQLVTAIEQSGGDLATLANIQAVTAGGDLIAARLKAMAAAGATEAAHEALAQGSTAAPADLAALESELAVRAAALAQVLANAISQAAQAKALQLAGGGLTAADTATAVGDYLKSLTDAYLTDQFGGAMSAARTGGRLAAMGENGATRYYISALLDVNCCGACAADDGREFASAEAIAAQMPSGFNKDCFGGPRCRCIPVAVYDEAAPSTGEGAA